MRIAEQAPQYCASCYASYPDKTYVDFDAAYDGPVINTDGLRVSIDDLIICDECLGTAARMIGMDTVKEGNVDRLKAEIAELRAELKEAKSYTAALERTFAQKPKRPVAARG